MREFTPDQFIAAVAKTNRDLENAAITLAQAVRAQAIATATASGDLGGDPKFSGWAPTLDTQVKPTTNPRFGAILTPTRTSAGPWTVAEQGRNMGETGLVLGPGVNRRTGTTARTKSGGLRKTRSFKSKRWNGYTEGKGTATEAGRRIAVESEVIAAKLSKRLMSRHLDVD